MMNTRFGLVLLAGLLIAQAGCASDTIEITLIPNADGSFQRTVHLTGSSRKDEPGAPSAERVKTAEAHYLKRLATDDHSVRLQGTFRTPPADVAFGGHTNRGAYTVWTSPLGHVGYYRERRPGRMDHYKRFQELSANIDLLMKGVAAVARQELKGQAGLDPLLAFIEGDVRQDAKELLFFLFEARAALPRGGDPKEREEKLFGVGFYTLQFLEERGYLGAADLSKILKGEGQFELLYALIAKKMKRPLDPELRKALAFFEDEKRLTDAWGKAAKGLGVKEKELAKAWEPIADGYVGLFDIFSSTTRLNYELQLPANATVLTSAERPEKNRITWTARMDGWPVSRLFYALWSVPAEDWQKKKLGRVALTGQELANLIFWEDTLPPEQVKAWRAALEKLDPAADLKKQLTAIRLAPAKPGDSTQTPEGASLIIDALNEAAKKEAG